MSGLPNSNSNSNPSPYSPGFYSSISTYSKRSAARIVPIIMDLLDPNPKSVLDVGCSTGEWLQEFIKQGVAADHVLGIEGDWLPQARFECPLYCLRTHDLEYPFMVDDDDFDLVISLEVAEHLSLERATGFVADLVACSPVVVFSAAIPGQGGTGHINCQWQSWWSSLFSNHGYGVYDPIRPLIWNDLEVAWWYKQNVLVFSRYPQPKMLDVKSNLKFELDLRHPQCG